MKQFEFKPGGGPPTGPDRQAPQAGYDHGYDVVPYPAQTPMMEVALSKNRRIVVAQEAQSFAPDYRQRGRCLGANPDLFLPERGESTLPGKKICAGCSVRCDCLEEGLLKRGSVGIWGGTSKRERNSIRSAREKLADQNNQPPN